MSKRRKKYQYKLGLNESSSFLDMTDSKGRELYCFGLTKCLNCNHSEKSHLPKGCSGLYLKGYREVICRCKSYRPEGNLEYLEWKYKKQNER